MASDIQFYRPATEEEFKPYILSLGGDWYSMDLQEMNAFMYGKVKENPRLALIESEIMDESELMFAAQLFNFGSYFPVYDIYDINVKVDDANVAKMTELYDYIKSQVDTVNAYLDANPGSYTTSKWTIDNQEFVTSHPDLHFLDHTWGESYASIEGRFNYPEESNGWEGLGLGINQSIPSSSAINFFDKQDQNLNGTGFDDGFWEPDTDLYTTPWPPVTNSNQSNRSARNSYVLSRMYTVFEYPGIGPYVDYFYFIEADFRLEKGMDSEFFAATGVDTSEVLAKMDEWDLINTNRESTYSGTRINIQRNLTTLEALELRMKTDKTIIDNME